MAPASILSSSLLVGLAAATTCLAASLPSTHLTSRATTCNGHSELCSRLYSNVTYIGAHDSYAIGSGTSNSFANQDQSITTQLNDGIRLLQAQAHKSSNSSATGVGIDLCHTSCSVYQGGAIEYWLSQIKSWVDANPNEVLSLLIVNSDDLPASTYAQAFESTGLASKMYSPSNPSSSGGVTKSSWPTLGSMIDSGKTVVAYLDNSADVSSVSYLLPEFSSIWENPYDQTSVPFNCSIDRSGEGQDTSTQMYLTNHFLDASLLGGLGTYPDVSAIYTTNSESSMLQDANNCASLHQGAYPTFMLVDYYDRPRNDVFAAAASMNGVSFTNSTSSSSSSSSSSGSGGTSAARGNAAAPGWTVSIGLAGLVAGGMAMRAI